MSRLRILLTAGSAAALVLTASAPALAASPTAPRAKACAKGGPCAIGDTGPGGGIVFMTPQTPGNKTGLYFEMAPDDWGGTALPPYVPWCEGPGATERTYTLKPIGTGQKNSRKIAKICTSSAAQLALDYSAQGRSDWFLPSRGELLELQAQANTKGLGGVWEGEDSSATPRWQYWSSSGGQQCVEYQGDPFQSPCAKTAPGTFVVIVKGKDSNGKAQPKKIFVEDRPNSANVRPIRSFPR